MKSHHIILMIVILSVMAGYCYISIQTETGPTFGVEIDLSKPHTIIWPCEIDYIGEDGEKGLRIPPNVGRGWLDEAGGSATYKFYIQNQDEYYIWIYSKWYDECTNAVYIRIDDQGKVIVGNDPVYNKWHWVRGFPVRLDQGTHTLSIANHSDNIEMLKVVLINSNSSGPEDSELTFSDLFYDGFDGCDAGNFTSWKIISGQWKVMDPLSQSCLQQNAMKGISEDEAKIIFFDESWKDYSFDMEVKMEVFNQGESELGICFGIQDADNYYILSFIPKKENNSEVIATISRQCSGQLETIESCDMPWPQREWCRLQIKGNTDSITFSLEDDDPRVVQLYNKIPVRGGIGLSLKGKTVGYFDNIHIRKIEAITSQRD